MIEDILGSKIKIKILRKMIIQENREFTFEELSRSMNLSFGAVHPALKSLLKTRIIIFRKIGRSKLYAINKRHPIFKEMKVLFKTEKESFLKIAIDFTKTMDKRGIKNVILFGSVARGEFTEKSDIDLLIIHSINEAYVKNKVSKEIDTFLDKYDMELVPLYMSSKEVIEKIKDFDKFILGILNEGKVLYGDRKWLEK